MSIMTASESVRGSDDTTRLRWRERLLRPVREILRVGLDPHSASLAVSVGLTLGLLPLPWGTSLLCCLVAWWLRLNQPLVQLVNYLCYPLQIALYLVYCRAGIHWFAADDFVITLPDSWLAFTENMAAFFNGLWRANLFGLTAWLVTALLLLPAGYLAVRLLMWLVFHYDRPGRNHIGWLRQNHAPGPAPSLGESVYSD